MDLRLHLIHDVVPWWLRSVDEVHGGIHTCWDNAGETLVSRDKYTWSQGRWAWLAAALAVRARDGRLALDPEPLERTALDTASFLRRHCLLPDGSTIYHVTAEGRPVATEGRLHASVYADLFTALGLAGAAVLEPEHGDVALQLLESAARRIRAGAVLTEPYPIPVGRRSLALPMMLVGVGDAVEAATGDPAAAGIVRAAGDDLVAHHLRGADLEEMPTQDGDRTTILGRHRTPGHALELVWFLHHARRCLPDTVTDPVALERIALEAMARGWDSQHGGLLRHVDVDGGAPSGSRTGDPYEQLVLETWDTKLWWPHAEALYCLRLLRTLGASAAVERWSVRIEDWMWEHFPEGPGREWTQILTREGQPLERVVALPVKDPFHIARALLYATDLDHQGAHP